MAANRDSAATLESTLDALFRGPRKDFVSERNAAAKELRAQGRDDDAAAIKALQKPCVSAWAVNQLWWTRRPQMDALLQAGQRQAAAVAEGAGPSEQAAAGQARRRALDRLLVEATQILTEGGNAAGAGMLRRICTSLEALAVLALREGGPHPGRLHEDLSPPGFEALGGFAVAPPAKAEPLSPPPRDTPQDSDARRRDAAALERAEQARDEQRRQTLAAARAMDKAAQTTEEQHLAMQRAVAEYDQAHEVAERARHAAEAAHDIALRARAEAARNREALTEARQAVERNTARLRKAEDAVEQARQRLATHDSS